MHRLAAFFLSFIISYNDCSKTCEKSSFSTFWNSAFDDLDIDLHLQINSYILVLRLFTYMLFLMHVTLAFLIAFIYPSRYCSKTCENTKFKKKSWNGVLMTLTLTLNKEFLHPVFIVSNRRHIACYIHISCFLVHRCKSYQKLLQNMSSSHFFHILEIVQTCIF